MSKFMAACITSIMLALGISACASVPSANYSLRDIQGAWWSSCNDPTAQFVIDHDQYSGDFAERHTLVLNGDILTLKNGLLSGHDIYVSGTPLAFRIIRANPSELVLRPLLARQGDWRLRSCEHAS